MENNLFQAKIRVIKSLANRDSYFFDVIEVIREPYIEAADIAEVKKILAEKYPQFFPTAKVYTRETKDQAQFFYAVIEPLAEYQKILINKGQWQCSFCNQIHENHHVSPARTNTRLFGEDIMFCESSDDYCMKEFLKTKNDGIEIPDDVKYITSYSPNYIYKCTEKATGKSYIGKTRNEPFFRWWNHLKHSNSPFGIYLKNTKLSDWTFEVIEVLPSNLPDSEVYKVESKYIIQYNSIANGFNSQVSKKSVGTSGKMFDEIINN